MKKLFGMLLVLITLIFTGCDNNKGPFEIKRENGKKILYSGEKPAKGWVENTVYDYYGESTKVYEIYFDDGLPAGDFKLYDLKGNLVIDAKGKWKNDIFEGEIKEENKNVIAKGKFAINTDFLLNFTGRGYGDFSFETLVDGDFVNDYYKYSKKNREFDGKYIFNGEPITRQNKIECTYDDGILNGEYISYYLNGKVKEKTTYKNGIKNGEYISYNTEGKISKKGKYLNNEKDGQWSEYIDNSEKKIVTYSEGKLISTQRILYDNGGNIEREVNYKENEKETYNTFYYKSGKVKAKIVYLDNYGNGNYKEYYENGNIKEEGNLKDGEKNGECLYYLESGKPYMKHIYNYGKVVSEIKL